MRKLKTTELPHDGTYARLQPSKIHGVGVFAIRNIPKGTYIFPNDDDDLVWINKHELSHLSPEVRKLYDDFAIIRGNYYGCPRSFNKLTPAWYLNESETPNVDCDKEFRFFTVRIVKKREELTVDYDAYSDRPTKPKPEIHVSLN
jgi:SET domain-containing protein